MQHAEQRDGEQVLYLREGESMTWIIDKILKSKWSKCRYRDGMNICKKKDAYVDSYAQIERHCKGCKETDK